MHHYHHILFIRSKSLRPSHVQWRGIRLHLLTCRRICKPVLKPPHQPNMSLSLIPWLFLVISTSQHLSSFHVPSVANSVLIPKFCPLIHASISPHQPKGLPHPKAGRRAGRQEERGGEGWGRGAMGRRKRGKEKIYIQHLSEEHPFVWLKPIISIKWNWNLSMGI